MGLLQTPLHPWHATHGATLVPFAGWVMPLQYAGIVEEHLGVRASAGVFDVSHMGKLLVRGPGALASVNRVSTNDVPDKPGRARYTHVCDDQGRVLDDVIFTVLGGGDVFCVCNAGPRERILAWFREHFREAEVIDLTQDYLCLAVQGPGSFPLLRGLLDVDPGSVKPFWGALAAWRGGAPEAVGWDAVGDALLRGRHDGPPPRLLFTRTGYTGEDGVELFPHRSMATEVWEALVEAGARPVGLGARDTLRLEKAYLLSGQDFDGARTSLEASGERWVKWDHEFIGREALRRQRDAGTYERLAAILLEERGVPRHGSALWHEGREVGSLTSGTLSPSLRRGIGLGYLPPALAVPGTAVSVRVRDRDLAARVVKPPFT